MFERCFPELWGFVLLDPARLAQAVPDAVGSDLLDRFSTTAYGDLVVRDGIAVAVHHVEAGYYTVVVRTGPVGVSAQDRVLARALLGTSTGALILCGLGYLATWDPDHPRHRRVRVPEGFYEVEVRFRPEPEDGTYEFVLTPH